MLTGTIDGLIHYTSGGNQAAGAGAVMLIVMQVITLGQPSGSNVYTFKSFSGSFYSAVQKIL